MRSGCRQAATVPIGPGRLSPLRAREGNFCLAA